MGEINILLKIHLSEQKYQLLLQKIILTVNYSARVGVFSNISKIIKTGKEKK